MKIGIFGDSWADINPIQHRRKDLDNLPWPLWIEDILNAEIICHANSATGLWYSFSRFLKHYKKYEKIVFVYTEYGRWNGLDDGYEGIANVREEFQTQWITEPDLKVASKKLVDVYNILYNDELNLWIFQQVFNQVNQLCHDSGIDLVNILAFEDHRIPIDTSNTKGAILHNMQQVSVNELQQSSRLEGYLGRHTDLRFCHLNTYNNKILANLVCTHFKQTNTIINLSTITDFSYDEKYLEYQFNEWDKLEK